MVKAGRVKLRFCGDQANKHAIEYFWVDTCYINEASHTELSEAIISMSRWYRKSVKCYVYLSDVTASAIKDEYAQRWWESEFRTSRWFKRGWTLQEFLALASVEFFTREGELLGSKTTLRGLIYKVTGIPEDVLNGAPLSYFSTYERLQWVARRQSKRVEDKAYCLLGTYSVADVLGL